MNCWGQGLFQSLLLRLKHCFASELLLLGLALSPACRASLRGEPKELGSVLVLAALQGVNWGNRGSRPCFVKTTGATSLVVCGSSSAGKEHGLLGVLKVFPESRTICEKEIL